MTRIKDPILYKELDRKLTSFALIHNMPGINTQIKKDCFIQQIIDSTRRIKVAQIYGSKNYPRSVADPNSYNFDPLKAAVFHKQRGDLDEAFWLVFLAIHFGKHKTTGWSLVKYTYSGLSTSIMWDWRTVSSNPSLFRNWLSRNYLTLKQKGKFSNHRRYTSIEDKGTGVTVESYVNWIGTKCSHKKFFEEVKKEIGHDKKQLFKYLFKSMGEVKFFGRLGKFDFLTMVGKLGLIDIQPDSTYLNGATGPLSGAELLFGVTNKRALNNKIDALESHLGLDFGMQIIEDSLCNWQKNPLKYIHFKG